jgi:hypothetical protein
MSPQQQQRSELATDVYATYLKHSNNKGTCARLGVNNFSGLTAAGLEDLDWAARAAILEHGHDTATKAQAAAHEAAHVVVGYAMGETIIRARIFSAYAVGRIVWMGSNDRRYANHDASIPVAISDNPSLALRGAVNDLAGFFGETLVGLSHPSSSLDERYRATAICEELDRVWGKPDEWAAGLAGYLVEEALQGNSQQFETIRAHLFRTKKLCRIEATRMLASVRPLDLDAAIRRYV